ncbi:LysR family transcriptional regulator [Rhodococcus opacus]|uniref:LysR family transcriptional regulator n=1 Tax=Rhodococcus opacus TaxID=37919 RepID=UPI001C48E7DF|nr:LysR family transcriptional regulator [Rhodococcus opacus]MBV6759069.1 LysR family transcriptional regulator [Rhodococcus opacus]
MDRKQIEAFLAVVENNGIAAGAEALSCSQSTISHRLDVLETELSVRLIARSRGIRAIELTEAGEHFFPLAEEMLSIFERAGSLRVSKAAMHISGQPSVANFVLAPRLAHFPEVFNDMSLLLTINTGHVPFVRHRQYDIVITPSRMETDQTVLRPFGTESYKIITGHRVAVERWETKKFLKIHPRNLDAENQVFVPWFGEWQKWHAATWKPGTHMVLLSAAELIGTFLTSREHWSMAPTSVARHYSAQGFEVLELMDQPPVRELYSIHHVNLSRERQKRIDDVLTYLKQQPLE